MKLPIKKGWLIAFTIITALIITNPTYKDLHEYKDSYCGTREAYCFIFSIYKCRGSRYLGVAKNFIYINEVQ